jgi:hypothetical protein
MAAIKLEQFGGMLPAWDPALLPTGQAAYSKNGYLFGGNLLGWRKPKLLHTLLDSTARFAYRIPSVSQAQAQVFFALLSNPHDGDTATIGDITYTFKTSLTDADPNAVLIGASALETAQFFTEAVTADSGQNTNAGTHYADNTVANGDVFYTQPDGTAPAGMADPSTGTSSDGFDYAAFGAFAFGAAFNNVKVAASAGGRIVPLYNVADIGNTTTTFQGGSNPTFDSSITSNSIWMEFADPDTTVVKSPVAGDEWNRFYWASPSDMPKYNTYDRIAAGQDPWLLGIPPPGCAPTLEVAGGGNNQTLGNFTLSGGEVYVDANTVYLIPFSTTGDTSILDVQFRLSGVHGVTDVNQTPTTNWAAVVYDDDGSSGDVTIPGKPGNLLNTTQIVTGVTSDEPNIANFLNPTGLSGNTVYWIGIIFDRPNYFAAGPAGGNSLAVKFPATFTNGPPGTAPAGMSTGQAGLNIWGDFSTSDVIEARSYVYTWVSAYGEEGPPSPPVVENGWSNGVWTVGLWLPPPDDLGVQRNLNRIRLYRTVVGQKSSDFFFVAEFPINDLITDTPTNDKVKDGAYVDDTPDSEVALNELIQTEDWFPPPANLQGFQVMANGMIAGFVGNEIWFCDPYHPWAWPPGKMVTSDFVVVGLGLAGGNLVVATAANPYFIVGNSPDNMVMQKCAQSYPCMARASIVSSDKACAYMSTQGMITVSNDGTAVNTTDLWITRDKWQQLVPQKYTRAIYLASQYLCFGTVSPPSVTPVDTSVAQRGFTIEIDSDVASFTIWPQPGGHRLGLQIMDSPVGADIKNVLSDPWSGAGVMIADGKVWYWDFSDAAPEIVPYTWKSKVYQQNAKRNYSAMKVFFKIPSGTPTQVTRNENVASDPSWLTLGDNQWGIIRTYVDYDGTGTLTLIDCREIRQSGELLRIRDGFKADRWQFEITARVDISNVQIATSVKELGSV